MTEVRVNCQNHLTVRRYFRHFHKLWPLGLFVTTFAEVSADVQIVVSSRMPPFKLSS